jgi:poly(A) polymerase
MRGVLKGKPTQPEADLWDHTMLVLEHLPSDSTFTLAFAALLHDVGKPECLETDGGRARFPNHEQVGAKIAVQLCRSLKLSVAERERISWLVGHHQDLKEARKLRESKLKQILAKPAILDLLALHRADALASTRSTAHVDYCEHYLRDQPAGSINPPPLLTGDDLVRHGLSPGPSFKRILEQTRVAQLDGKIRNEREALEWLDRWLDQGVEGPPPPFGETETDADDGLAKEARSP